MRSESIHPRAFYGNDGAKKNTCKPRSRRRFERALAGIEKHLIDHPHDAMATARAAELQKIIDGLPVPKRELIAAE